MRERKLSRYEIFLRWLIQSLEARAERISARKWEAMNRPTEDEIRTHRAPW